MVGPLSVPNEKERLWDRIVRRTMALSQGDRLGPFEILSRIGAGGMGEVWKARDTRLERTVAIKRLNVQHGARFKAEARAIAARWIVERDYEELKQELGLGHYEGRSWRGFHHHATLCIAAYGFLVAERNRFSPSARAGHVELSAPELPSHFRPRGSPGSPRTA
jgi:hypothetical protein